MECGLLLTPREVYDNSILSTHASCPRLALYQYLLNRSPSGVNYSIGFGIAFHKFKEILDSMFLENPDASHEEMRVFFGTALNASIASFGEDPPIGHSKEWLNVGRLTDTCIQSFEHWKRTRHEFKVISSEQAFDLELPWGVRFGGRFDKILEWNNKLWIGDYKTTSRMGSTYARQFEPNHQMTGYVWGGRELSGRPIQGVLVEVVYNTKTKGPEFHPFPTTRTEGHIIQWMSWVKDEIEALEAHVDRFPEEGYLAFPQRTNSCSDYAGCYFRDCCQKSGGSYVDNWLLDNTIESVWDFMNPDKEEGTPV